MKILLNGRFITLSLVTFSLLSSLSLEAAPRRRQHRCHCIHSRKRLHIKDKIPTSINLINQNGLSETITSRERLKTFGKVDFLSPQSYQKVMRTFKTSNGTVLGIITTYHSNGQLKQYLETLNSTAYGPYREWFSDGKQKVEAWVTGGIPDVTSTAENSWLFDGISYAWNENGSKIAEIRYIKGALDGSSFHYHPNGTLWKICPFKKNKPHGVFKIFKKNGDLFSSVPFSEGLRQGKAFRLWNLEQTAAIEEFENDLLITATYSDAKGNTLSTINNGDGIKTVFGIDHVIQTQEYKNGKQEGLVTIFDSRGYVLQTYHLHDGQKDGLESFFYPQSSILKLSITWSLGILNGTVTSYYQNGQIKSEKEFQENKKNGLLTCYYPNGDIMLIEEYAKDLLTKGEYFGLGDQHPKSKVDKGCGTACLFSDTGTLLRTILYQDGIPDVD